MAEYLDPIWSAFPSFDTDLPPILRAIVLKCEAELKNAVEGDHKILDIQRVIANCDPKGIEEVRADPSERENAQMLERQMAKFEQQISALDDTDPRALEAFIWGPWRQWISELYAVDPSAIADMGDAARNIKTHEIPPRLRTLLGEEFSISRLIIEDANIESLEEEETLNESEWECPFCSHMDYEELSEDEEECGDETGCEDGTEYEAKSVGKEHSTSERQLGFSRFHITVNLT
ncbi:hypothetical protein QBC40DRAFT_322674 [Triangularia verruculosa]|uniref:Uncharacterized protein n=1 Tax=Triangularia verruculosa TaxID=2587418 RepID=A0AAN6XKL4_9PEZI|nr:hypothetical protein QBC40DRAFT_322674 [Triangularia verruculosa]